MAIAMPAAAADLPPALLAKLVVKILPYDQSLASRTHSMKVLVLFKSGSVDSEDTAKAIASGLRESAGTAIQGTPLSVSKAAYEGADSISQCAAVFIAPGLAGQAGAIAEAAAAKGAITFSGSLAATRAGSVVGLVAEDGTPKIYINLPSAKRAGAEFSPGFLNLAQVLR